MEALNTLYLPGALTLWCAVVFMLCTLWGYAKVLWGDESSQDFARRAYSFFTVSILLAGVVLGISLLRRDFRIEYVYQYSGLDLPIHYQFAAFWAGQKGSFLIWLVFGALIGLPLARWAGAAEARVMTVYTLTLSGLVFILVRENPFVMLTEAPLDGKGLNPLLQDDWMVIHPPIMFVGYAASAIPFSFAIAALWKREYDHWATRAFPWALGGFLVLGCAILMGGYWAYKTLGWGGYWGWDPVENASLIPWLLGVVLIHGLYLEKTRKRYRRSNLVFACLLYLSVLYGTFLTRSGVLADFSVHSFVDLGISRWLVSMMLSTLLVSVGLLAWRLREVKTEANEDPALSRGTFLVLSTIVVSISTLIITFGTSAPLLTRFLEDPGQVGPEFYNLVNLPVALLMALLLAMVPFLTWRGTQAGELLRKMIPSLIGSLILTSIAFVMAVRDPFHVLFVFLAALALGTNLQKVVERFRTGGARLAGGYLAHVGVGMIFLGIIFSSAYDRSAKVTLEQGEPQEVADLTLTFNRFVPRGALPEACGRKECMEVEVVRADGSSYMAYPKLFINDRTRQLMANPHVRSYLSRDLYISPIEYDPGAAAGTSAQLLVGESFEVGDATIRFVDFDLTRAQPDASGSRTVGATLEVSRGSETLRLVPQYRLNPNGFVETPPVTLPGGGQVVFAAINPNEGRAVIRALGVDPGPDAAGPTLALDVTQKPLIRLVWWGLYIVLIGGALATTHRFFQARTLIKLQEGT